MKKITLLLFLTLMSALLFSCQSNNNHSLDPEKPYAEFEEDDNTLNFDGEITKVVFDGNISSSGVTVSDNEDFIEIFRSIMSSAVKEEGIVNITEPKFQVYIVFKNKNKQGFDLWVGEKGQKSILMKNNDTQTIYTISEKMTDKLIDLIN